MTKPNALLACLAALTASLAHGATFEGVLKMKVTTARGGGNVTVSVGKPGTRAEVDMSAQMSESGGEPLHINMVVLTRRDDPKKVIMLDTQNKKYTELDPTAMSSAQEHAYTLKKLGREKAGGYDCEHVMVTTTTANGEVQQEMWLTKGLVDASVIEEALSNGRTRDAGLAKALKANGLAGYFPVKSIIHGAGPAPSATMELVSVEKKSLPASLFEVPAGYEKSAGPAGLGATGAHMTPEQQQMMMDRLKNLTPEQRAAVMGRMGMSADGGR